MTAARHRSATGVDVHPPAGPELKGQAPGGMWLVAWRQHRLQIAVTLALIAVVIAAQIVFREIVIARFAAAGCDLTAASCTSANGGDLWYSDGFSTWYSLLEAVVLLAPIVLGAFVGAPIFTREFSRGTQVFALTQSVGRLRWWAIKITVAGVPLIVGLVVLGFVTGWIDGTTGYTAHHALNTLPFATRAIMPAAHGLIAVAIAVAAGIVARSTVAALVTGLIASGLVLIGLVLIQPHVLPASRQMAPYEDRYVGAVAMPFAGDPDVAIFDSGYIGADGRELNGVSIATCFPRATAAADKAMGITGDDAGTVTSSSGYGVATSSPETAQARDSPAYQRAYDRAMVDCAHSLGIVDHYTDYLPGSMLWPLRWTMTGIAAVIAALFLLLSAVRLRAAVAKR